jgi:hypothetical protein
VLFGASPPQALRARQLSSSPAAMPREIRDFFMGRFSFSPEFLLLSSIKNTLFLNNRNSVIGILIA